MCFNKSKYFFFLLSDQILSELQGVSFCHKELLEKETWYKDRKDDEGDMESPMKYRKITGGSRKAVKTWRKQKN